MQYPFLGFGRIRQVCRIRRFAWAKPLHALGGRSGRAVSLAALGLLMAVSGCDIINPDEAVPAYLRIEPFVYNATTVAGSPPTANITSAFVYAENQLLGVFDLPAKVPVLREGNTRIRVVPAIFPDGQRGTRVTYPFYISLSATPNLTPGATIRLDPTTSFSATNSNGATAVGAFDVRDDFTNAGETRAFDLQPTNTGLQHLGGATENGRADRFGQVTGFAVGNTDAFILSSSWVGGLPQKGAPIYLELEYRSTMPFQVGMRYGTTSAPTTEAADLTVYPSRTWTKLYVNLTDEVSRQNDLSLNFQVFFKGFPTGAADDVFSIDNVRLVRPL